jgi:hypothetical protein
MPAFPMMKIYGASIGGFCIDKRGRQKKTSQNQVGISVMCQSMSNVDFQSSASLGRNVFVMLDLSCDWQTAMIHRRQIQKQSMRFSQDVRLLYRRSRVSGLLASCAWRAASGGLRLGSSPLSHVREELVL